MHEYTLQEIMDANVKRCVNNWHAIEEWSASDWAVAFAGEAGETCNAVKKMNRRTMYTKRLSKDPATAQDAVKAIALELADTIHYATLLAARLGIDLNEAVVAKFNTVSEERGCTERM